MTQTDPQLSRRTVRPREADAVLTAAQRVDAQLDRLSAWKHQLARQMELLRRDGIKLLERQKTAAQEKADLAAAQATLAADRESLAASRQALAAQARELDTRAAALAAAEDDLTELDARKTALAQQLADAQATLDTHRAAAEIAAQAVADEHRGLAEARARRHTADAELQQTSSHLASLRTQADALNADLAGAADRRDTLQAELAALESANRAAGAALAEARQALDDAQSQHAQILQQARDAAAATTDLARRAADFTDLDTRAQALDDRAAQLNALAADLDTRSADLHQLAAELDHRQSAITDHEAAWLARDVALRDAAEQLEAQRRELAHAQQELQHAAEQAVRDAAVPPQPVLEPPAADPHAAERHAALQRQVATLETQNESLLRTLSDLQASADHQVGEALLARNTLECELLQLRQELELLRGQRLAPVFEPPAPPAAAAPAPDETLALQTLTWHRDRLLHRALTLRQKRRQARDAARALAGHFQDIARQREELRAKKDNLELVKRFLEKQEMVMARKLADHNALRTVAAVGIFLLMILGSSFVGIYTFLSPVYRTEAVIHTAPGNAEADIDGWLNRQVDFIKSPEVTSAAWRILRSPDNHYAMHDVREEWLNSFTSHLTISPDDAARTLTLRYTGPAAEGVSQVVNALASAYVNPNLRDATEATHLIGAGATLESPAPVPASPAQDHRFTTALASAAAAVFLSLVAVMSFRHMVFRQLREIDAMADPNDLSDLSDEAALQPEA